MTKRLIAVLTVCLLAATALSGVALAEDGVLIGCSMAHMKNDFYVSIKEGLESALKDGDELICTDSGLDVAKQINDIEDFIQRGVDVVMIDPVDSKGVTAAIEACKRAGVPVIAFNNQVEEGGDYVTSSVISDNYMAGTVSAQAIAKAIGGKGDIAILLYSIVSTAKLRSDGFVDEIANYPDIHVVNTQEMSAASTDVALPIMESVLQATPGIAAVFAINDPAAVGAVAAIESANKLGQIQVVGVDGSAEAVTLIKDGKMLATAAQYPFEIGAACMTTAYSMLAGEAVEAIQMIPVGIIDASNAE